jgi:hypothetical protein
MRRGWGLVPEESLVNVRLHEVDIRRTWNLAQDSAPRHSVGMDTGDMRDAGE